MSSVSGGHCVTAAKCDHPGGGAAGLRAEPYLKSHALAGGKLVTGRKTGVTEAGARHDDAADGDVDVAGILESDVLCPSGLQFEIAETGRGRRYLDGRESFMGNTGKRDRGRGVSGIAGDLDGSGGASGETGLEGELVIYFLGWKNRAGNGRASERKLGTLEGHRIER